MVSGAPGVTFSSRVFPERGGGSAPPRKPAPDRARLRRGARAARGPAGGPRAPRSPVSSARARRRPSPRPAFISPTPGCNPSFYFLVAPLRGRAQCWEFTSVSALKLSRSMSRERSQFCLSVSLFQEGKHSRERGGAAGGGGRGRRPREEEERAGGRPAAPRVAAPRRDLQTPPPRSARSRAPAAPRAPRRRPPARPARALADPRGGCRERCWKKLLK